ncbi:MAG: zinc ribbon domain-containing protein [SAR324 cluster bacterium]|nr:zinc ribbon domain-containing protein [SAR324 cluster bacterium]
MECPKCGQDNPAHARFCLQCGSPQPLQCPACGESLPPHAAFCFSCGQKLDMLFHHVVRHGYRISRKRHPDDGSSVHRPVRCGDGSRQASRGGDSYRMWMVRPTDFVRRYRYVKVFGLDLPISPAKW